ncbi:hypothetical protein GTQ34_10890 [Muricauda sp. JGD-17]|uniref:Uncharacterized protein n=1 Tax=Flagellimonas ochracea TaxID=2696472 RepID=A0A964WXR6_9FLAO|nr:hypothetical protein [Allomuricauda ochracea]NAY92426.1 hypothetical protein [Allomuricauda ochracea]
MLHQLHLAAQYLATAGKSFIPHREDDSHTNLAFSTAEKSLFTRPLDDAGTLLGLNYNTFSLNWKSSNPQFFYLKGKTHKDIIAWISEMTKTTGLEKSYAYNLHYDLPYSLEGNESFALSSEGEVQELIRLRSLAQTVLTKFLKEENLESEVRVWPHHFDTGAFAHLHDGSGKSIGFGMAIPDNTVDDLYFYVSGYRGSSVWNTWAFKPLTHGKWINNGFKGAVLAASQTSEENTLYFLKEALAGYKNWIQ